MKKLIDITGLQVIKPKTKETTAELKELHYKGNQLLFEYNYSLVSKRLAKNLINQFTKIGVEISDLNLSFKPKAQNKQHEILEILRKIVKNISKYHDNYDDSNDKEDAQKVIGYQVYQYIKGKDEPKSENDIIKSLKKNVIINRCYGGIKDVNTDRFKQMQTELIEQLVEKYQL